MMRVAIAFAVAAVLAGCASPPVAPVVERAPSAVHLIAAPAAPAPAPSDTYTVKRGDTLYGIALDHGMDYRELASLNGITNSSRINAGDVLRLRAPAPPQAAPADTGVQVMPITGVGPLVSRQLDSRTTRQPAVAAQAKPAEAKPAEATPAEAKSAVPAGPVGPMKPDETTIAKVEPRPQGPEAVPAPAKPETEPGVDEEDRLDWIWPVGGKIVARFADPGNKGVDIAGKLGDPVIAAEAGRVVYSGTGLRGYGKLIIIKHNKTFLSAYAHNNQILVKEGQNVTKGQKIGEVGATDADSPMLHFEIRRFGKPVDPLQFLPEGRR